MSKFVAGRLLVLAVFASLAACGETSPPDTAPAPESATPDPGEMASQPHPVPTGPAVAVDLSGIEKADGGQTVAEVYAGKDELEGETVVIRGKVVKVNAGIMDRNWLHIRDGSGADGTNDLTITTSNATPAVGDTVVVTGAVGLNRDFGMGYTYPIIVEDAQVTVEAAGE